MKPTSYSRTTKQEWQLPLQRLQKLLTDSSLPAWQTLYQILHCLKFWICLLLGHCYCEEDEPNNEYCNYEDPITSTRIYIGEIGQGSGMTDYGECYYWNVYSVGRGLFRNWFFSVTGDASM